MPDRISIEDAFDLVGQAATETPVVAAPKVKEVDGISNGDLNRLFTPKSEQMKRMRSDLRVGNEWRFGIRQFDEATLGGARAGQLITLIGKTHTGKTMVGMNMVARNPKYRSRTGSVGLYVEMK